MAAIPELQQFRDIQAAKLAVKEKVMVALGEAKHAEGVGADASPYWQIVAEQGMSGVEGQHAKALQDLADACVAAHPELFAHLEPYAVAGGNEPLVLMSAAFGRAGLEDEKTVVTMFELAKFERQQIGIAPAVSLRVVGR